MFRKTINIILLEVYMKKALIGSRELTIYVSILVWTDMV